MIELEVWYMYIVFIGLCGSMLLNLRLSLYRLLIIVGVILLVSSSRLILRLTWLYRRFKHSGVDRNFGHRSGSSARLRDSSPSAIIQTTTLQNLMLSSKAKADAWKPRRRFMYRKYQWGRPGTNVDVSELEFGNALHFSHWCTFMWIFLDYTFLLRHDILWSWSPLLTDCFNVFKTIS